MWPMEDLGIPQEKRSPEGLGADSGLTVLGLIHGKWTFTGLRLSVAASLGRAQVTASRNNRPDL